ncbi:MAG: RNA-dependent RNA polymerase [Sanya levivirus 2]|nr:MAG: RNA-dependent RNA polymerase [Sanya levivirus 2]
MATLKQLISGHKDDLKAFTVDVNTTISEYISSQKYIPLGPLYQDFTTFDEAQYHLLRHRMAKKWGAPDTSHQNSVRLKSVQDVFDYDNQGPTSLDVLNSDIDPFLKRVLYEARLDIHDALRSFYRFDASELRMPSGQSDLSDNSGDVSVLAKLRNKEQWRVTADCFDLFSSVVYRTPALKASARKHIGQISKHEASVLYSCYSDYRDVGYRVFRELLLSEVVTIVPGSRVDTVPKELDKQRVISCEPFGNMICQSIIEMGIRRTIKSFYGIDLNTSQELHKALIRDLENATIDFSNASNSNYLVWVEFFYPKHVFRQLEAARSPCATFSGGKGEPHIHNWTMISPMGNGFTFGLMSLTLLAIARRLDSYAHVFGDDVIIHQDVADVFIQCCSLIGFNTNLSKTFTRGFFRESCGGFTFNGQFLTSFEFRWAEKPLDAIVLVNKVLILANETQDTSLLSLAAKLLSVTPSLCKKWGPRHTLNSGCVVVTSNTQIKRKHDDPKVKALRNVMLNRRDLQRFCSKIQSNISRLDFSIELESVNKTYSCFLPMHNANAFWTYFFLYNGRCTAPHFKECTRNPLKEVLIVSYIEIGKHVERNKELLPYTSPYGPPSFLFRRSLKTPNNKSV